MPTVGDNDPVVPRKSGNLCHGDFQVLQLLLYGSLLAFSDQCITPEGHQKHLFFGYLFHMAPESCKRRRRASSRIGGSQSLYS